MLETLINRAFFEWGPPATSGSFTVNFGIFDKVTQTSPTILLYDPVTLQQIPWILDIDYTLSDISTAFFRINYTAQTIINHPDNAVLVVLRNTSFTQGIQFEEGDSFPVKEVEDGLDKLTMVGQDAKDIFDLTIRVPYSDMYDESFNPQSLDTLPGKTARKNRYLYFDENGDPTAVSAIITGSILFSAWGEELVNKIDAEAGRAHLYSAHINGDNTEEFLVAGSSDPDSAVPLSYLQGQLEDGAINTNLIDNSQMYVSQRGFIDGLERSVNSDAFFFDRWQILYGSNAVVTTKSMIIKPPVTDARPYQSQIIKISTASTAIGADERLGAQQVIEDRRTLSVLDSVVTVGAWVRSTIAISAPDCLCIALIDGIEAHSYVHEYEIEAGTWTYITFSVDLSVISVSTAEGLPGLKIAFTLACGSNLNGATNNTWFSGLAYGTANQYDYSSVLGAKFLYSNVAVVLGNNSLPIDGSAILYRPYQQELSQCRRFLRDFNYPQFTERGTGARLWVLVDFDEELASSPVVEHTTPTITVDHVDGITELAYRSESLTKFGGTVELEQVSGPVDGWYVTSMRRVEIWFISCEI